MDLLHQLSLLPDTEALEVIRPLFTVQQPPLCIGTECHLQAEGLRPHPSLEASWVSTLM